MYVSNPFYKAPNYSYTGGDVGDGTYWPVGFDLSTMLYFFYEVITFKVDLNGFGLGSGLGLDDVSNSTNVAANGYSKRQILTPPSVISEAFEAERVANKTSATAQQKQDAIDLRKKATLTHITTEGQYPVHIFAGTGGLIKMDFGQVRRLGNLYFPRIEATAGVDFESVIGAYLWGEVSLQLPGMTSGFLIGVYGNSLGSLSGSIKVDQVYSDLQLSANEAREGDSITIGFDKDSDKKFTGFENVKFVSFDGFSVPFTVSDENGNEKCSVVVPTGARSNYFAFVSEEDSGNRYNQFTVPHKLTVIKP